MTTMSMRDSGAVPDVARVQSAKVSAAPAPPPELPDALWQVVSRALQPDPAQRYRSAEEMATVLADLAASLKAKLAQQGRGRKEKRSR